MANVATGDVYPLPEGMKVEVGEHILAEMVPRRTDAHTQDLLAALAREEHIVAVSGEVAHKLRLGERELQRRMRRKARARRS